MGSYRSRPSSHHFPPLERDKTDAKRTKSDAKTKSDVKLTDLARVQEGFVAEVVVLADESLELA